MTTQKKQGDTRLWYIIVDLLIVHGVGYGRRYLGRRVYPGSEEAGLRHSAAQPVYSYVAVPLR
jgi:hypothetical protein